jgi:hypothetical protein
MMQREFGVGDASHSSFFGKARMKHKQPRVAAVCGPKEMGGNRQVAIVCGNGCLRIAIEF